MCNAIFRAMSENEIESIVKFLERVYNIHINDIINYND